MRGCSFLIALLIMSSSLFGQTQLADSILTVLKKDQPVKVRIGLMQDLCYEWMEAKPDTVLLLAQQSYYLSQQIKDLKAASVGLTLMASANRELGNYSKSLSLYIEQLKIEEQEKDYVTIAKIYLRITSLYDQSGDYEKAIGYARKADTLVNAEKIAGIASYIQLDLGDIFEKQNKLDSALLCTRRAYALSVADSNTQLIGTSLTNLGNILLKAGLLPEALQNYRNSLPYHKDANDFENYTESLVGMAKVFQAQEMPDSAIYFGRSSFTIAFNNHFLTKALDASNFLTGLFKTQKNIDSAFVYQNIMIGIKDSIESRDKVRDLQTISAGEQIRQAELEQTRQEQIKDRAEKLQLLLIGLIIPLVFLLSVLISQKKVHTKLIEFTGIVSVLLFFEYITLLLHPFIAEKTNHSPIIEIIIFVIIAAILTPSHHKIQHWLLEKLRRYNYLKYHAPAPEPSDLELNENITEADKQAVLPSRP